jgi:hypothetical protein
MDCSHQVLANRADQQINIIAISTGDETNLTGRMQDLFS